MTVTVTVTDNTVHADDIILKLDSLVTAYDEVLSMAKKQLEDFSITEEDWSRIYERLTRRIDYYDLGTAIMRDLVSGFERMRIDPEGERFADADDYRLARTLMDRIRHDLEGAVKDYLISQSIQAEMDTIRSELRQELRTLAITAAKDELEHLARDQVRTADQQRDLVRQLLTSCFGSELRAMVREATSQASA